MAFNCPTGVWVQAPMTDTDNPYTFFFHGKISSAQSGSYLCGYATSLAFNVRGAFVSGHGADATKFNGAQAGDSAQRNMNSTSAGDLNWHTHIIISPLTGSPPYCQYYMDNEGASAVTGGTSTYALDRLAVGDMAGWLQAYTVGNIDCFSVAVWNIALNAAERQMLTATKWPPFVRPDAIVAFHPMDGLGYNHGSWGGHVMAATGSPTIIDAPPCKRKF